MVQQRFYAIWYFYYYYYYYLFKNNMTKLSNIMPTVDLYHDYIIVVRTNTNQKMATVLSYCCSLNDKIST